MRTFFILLAALCCLVPAAIVSAQDDGSVLPFPAAPSASIARPDDGTRALYSRATGAPVGFGARLPGVSLVHYELPILVGLVLTPWVPSGDTSQPKGCEPLRSLIARRAGQRLARCG
jgi:hypothetical protein